AKLQCETWPRIYPPRTTAPKNGDPLCRAGQDRHSETDRPSSQTRTHIAGSPCNTRNSRARLIHDVASALACSCRFRRYLQLRLISRAWSYVPKCLHDSLTGEVRRRNATCYDTKFMSNAEIIKASLLRVRERIAQAALRSGRSIDAITLIGVSKT